MEWLKLETEEDLERIKELSKNHPVLIFKHSTRCSISATALSRLERSWKNAEIKPYFLDLLSNRPLSNKIAEIFRVDHESPQALLIRDGECCFHVSHMGISYDELVKH